MGRCRRCRCTKYDCGRMQRIANLSAIAFNIATYGFGRLLVQPDHTCICGHHANDHY